MYLPKSIFLAPAGTDLDVKLLRLVVNPFVGVSVPARTKLIELGGKLPRQEWQKM
jgi:hypothetical protein